VQMSAFASEEIYEGQADQRNPTEDW